MNWVSPLMHADHATRRALCDPRGSPQEAPLAALADSLSDDLERLIDAPLPIPEFKARLTRIGGRCPTHGTLLEFNPFAPHEHRCARCGRAYQGREHDEWWAMGAQLWTAERAVHAAALYSVRGAARHAHLAARILREYTARYATWPNRDNVLGPTRPFFSTYLESIWLLNLSHATALLETADDGSIRSLWSPEDASRLRDAVLEPSAMLVAGYHEGRSNRQVWNEVAICSAWRLLGRGDAAHARLLSDSGLYGLLSTGLDADGFWYEGENYHLFAHRGLWYGVELLRAFGDAPPAELDARYSAGFMAPFLGVLPDHTFPSRRDSQYASSIRQWRTAEWCELGFAHGHDARLAGVLSRLYRQDIPRGDTGRAWSTADAERNTSPTRLTRADLSWRALLMADAALPDGALPTPTSVCLPSQGLAVIRRDAGRTYVALEGGQSGGGHGHPDLLSLTLQCGNARFLDDPGTGSYVEARLAWYRSTWAHHAPMFNGQSQAQTTASLAGFADDGSLGWVVKRADGIAPGVQAERMIVVAEGFLIDVLTWRADGPDASVTPDELALTLPIAAAATVTPQDAVTWRDVPDVAWLDPGAAFQQDVRTTPMPSLLRLLATSSCAHPDPSSAPVATTARVWYAASRPAWLSSAIAPGAPGHAPGPRHWLTVQAARGRVMGVWSWPTMIHQDGVVDGVQIDAADGGAVRVVRRDGTVMRMHLDHDSWCVAEEADERRVTRIASSWMALTGAHAGAFDTIRAGMPAPPDATARDGSASSPKLHQVPRVNAGAADAAPGSVIEGSLHLPLGEPHYVRTELPWTEAGAPTADLYLGLAGDWLLAEVIVPTGPPVVPSGVVADGMEWLPENPLDNEPADVNADGVQWYMNPPSDDVPAKWMASGLIVPAVTSLVHETGRSTTLQGPKALWPRVWWQPTTQGWCMRLCWARAALPLDESGTMAFELVINERPAERERRRGQLVLSGGGGFGYLAGARRPPSQHVRLQLPPVSP